MDDIAAPHDTYFRESFSRRYIAEDFLRHHLPAPLLAEMDLTSLEVSNDTYVSTELRTAYSDLVYRVRCRDGELVIYLLFEHKSSPDHWTLLQLLRYLVAEGDQYRKQHPAARHLPPIYPPGDLPRRQPVAIADPLPRPDPAPPTGPGPLRTPVSVRAARHLCPHQRRDQRRRSHPTGAVSAARHLQRSTGGAPAGAGGLIARVNDQGTALEILESLLRYYVQGTQRVDEHDVRELLQQTPSGDPLMQTFIDRYIEQGRVQGHVQGWEQGIEHGKQQGEAAVLLRQILLKFGPPSEAVYRLVSAADTETLLRWSERILTAESVDALLN